MRIFVICRQQFGYLMDTYSYCRHLSSRHEITYLDLDFGKPEVPAPGTEVIHVSRKGGRLARHLRFLRKAAGMLASGRFDICLITYFPGCAVLRLLFPRMKFVLDIRSGSISSRGFGRKLYNILIRLQAVFFRHRIILSQSLKDHLSIGGEATIIPVGAESISAVPRSFEDLRMLYVGTLQNRNIDMTIQGLRLYLDSPDGDVPISYTIVGDGMPGQLEDLRNLACSLGLEDRIDFTGHVPHDQLKPLFDKSNVGISFVPSTPYYDCQPPTKTFEYLLSGLPVIATQTHENRRVITDGNGILIEDSPEGFRDGIKTILQRKSQYDSKRIIESSGQYSWACIVDRLDCYLSGIVSAR